MAQQPDNAAGLERDYLAGSMPSAEICKRYGLTPVALFKWAHERGLKYGAHRSTAEPETPTVHPSVDKAIDAAVEATVADVAQAEQSARDDWQDAKNAYAAGCSLKSIAEAFHLDPWALLDRVYREEWTADLRVMIEDLQMEDGDSSGILAELLGPQDSHGHACDECGADVKRPVYCGRACQQRAYRSRKKLRGEHAADPKADQPEAT